MRIGGNGYLHTGFTGQTSILSRQVQPVRTGIDLKETPVLPRMISDSIHVQFVTRTLEKQSAGRVSENVEIPIIHGAKNALRLFLLSKAES